MFSKGRKIAVVGGTGKMGRLISRLLKKDGFKVTVCSRRLEAAKKVAKKLGVSYNTIRDGVREAEVVVVSVPLENTYQVCKDVAQQMRKGALLVEISSVKTGITDKLTKELPKQIKYLSIHPLFGPQAKSLNQKNVAIIKTKMTPCSRQVIVYLKGKGAQITFLSVDEHDKAMAVAQVMHHFAMLAFIYSLTNQLRKFKEPHKLLTRSLNLTLKSVNNLLKNMEAMTSIQQFNPYAKEMRATYLKLISTLNKKDPKEISAKILTELQKLPLQEMKR